MKLLETRREPHSGPAFLVYVMNRQRRASRKVYGLSLPSLRLRWLPRPGSGVPEVVRPSDAGC